MGKRILVIEDDLPLRNLFRGIVAAGGHTVYESSTREEAIDLISEKDVELLVCDIEVEDGVMLDVIEVCCNHNLDVIVITANEDYFTRCRDMGVLAFITKPVAAGDLMNLLNNIENVDIPGAYIAPRARA